MKAMNISEARQRLPSLISELVVSGEEVTIIKHGKPVAKLVIYTPEEEQNNYPLRGLTFQVHGDFDAPLPDMWEALEE
ncbi:MAG: type II toxin-antitoxin system Phd/YefM family antitoxin [Desulfonatronovibrionaceae bacterium]